MIRLKDALRQFYKKPGILFFLLFVIACMGVAARFVYYR